jgi:hypothetical protein
MSVPVTFADPALLFMSSDSTRRAMAITKVRTGTMLAKVMANVAVVSLSP